MCLTDTHNTDSSYALNTGCKSSVLLSVHSMGDRDTKKNALYTEFMLLQWLFKKGWNEVLHKSYRDAKQQCLINMLQRCSALLQKVRKLAHRYRLNPRLPWIDSELHAYMCKPALHVLNASCDLQNMGDMLIITMLCAICRWSTSCRHQVHSLMRVENWWL